MNIDLGPDFKVGDLQSRDAELLGGQLSLVDPWLRYGITSNELTDFFSQKDPLGPRYALRSQGRLAGICVVRMKWLRGPYIQFLGLLPKFQGLGFGGMVLNWVEASAIADKQRHVWITVSEFNDGARSLYERHGYQEVVAVPDIVKDGFSEILLRKRI